MVGARNQQGAGGEEPRWTVGVYIRLSKEEQGRSGDDSNSVRNQRALLEDYCQQQRAAFREVLPPYVDDGFSGTDTNRAGFQRLLGDIYARRVTCVVVKDLSRLSRNYTDAGSLIENLFVRMDVRFISLAEGIDSYQNPDSLHGLMVPITNVINDNFCYQTSQKIRQVFDYKRRKGEFIGSFAAYGYEKDPQNRHAFVVDREAAQVVADIYRWFLEGMSKAAIVRRLNDCGVLCPSAYKRSKGLRYHNPSGAETRLWSAKTVGDILKNPIYAGDMVQGRQRVKSYKVHTQEQVPPSQWYVVPDTHEAIVDRAVFDRVQALLARDTRTPARQREVYLFGGMLRCGDCGKAMSRSRVKDKVYYFCRTYKDQSKVACTKHSIPHPQLEAAVLEAIRREIAARVDVAETLQAVARLPGPPGRREQLEAAIEARGREQAKIAGYRRALYEDWKDGVVTEEDYREMSRAYRQQQADVKRALEALGAERDALEEAPEEGLELAAFRRLGNIDRLTREVLTQLVDCIWVYEGKEIVIRFAFSRGEGAGEDTQAAT